ncbi:hypothetical protein D5018_17860 [Parashewanella curva]|uniref:Uncharacterized protein n=1 Tax=Parashewanella curva TaxID=2338552 RepID=A0A3L8PSD2_9GAMM|nr:hypothetical protein [Parashewanella curva]RLV58327.1 hypothetical protein D5018_17860 [Parashewanella curva]
MFLFLSHSQLHKVKPLLFLSISSFLLLFDSASYAGENHRPDLKAQKILFHSQEETCSQCQTEEQQINEKCKQICPLNARACSACLAELKAQQDICESICN